MNCNVVSIIAITALVSSLVVVLFLMQKRCSLPPEHRSYIPLQHLVQYRLVNDDGALYLECLDLNSESVYRHPVVKDASNIPTVYSYITGEKYIPHLVTEVGEVGIDQVYQDEQGNFVIYNTESATRWSQVEADHAGQVFFKDYPSLPRTAFKKVNQVLNQSLQRDGYSNEFLITSKSNEAITVHPLYVNSYTGLPVVIDQLTGAAYYVTYDHETTGKEKAAIILFSMQIDRLNKGGYVLTDIISRSRLTVASDSGVEIDYTNTFSPLHAFKHSVHHKILANPNYNYKVLYCEDQQLAAAYGYQVLQVNDVEVVYSCLTGYYRIQYNQSNEFISVEALSPQQNEQPLQIRTGLTSTHGRVEISLKADSTGYSVLECFNHDMNRTEIYPTFINTYTSDLLVYERITGQAYIVKNMGAI